VVAAGVVAWAHSHGAQQKAGPLRQGPASRTLSSGPALLGQWVVTSLFTDPLAGSAPAVIDALRDPACYPEAPARVDLAETHISCVFLGEHTVYKLKKPVDFGFLDYTTPELRRHACEEEVRLNTRLRPLLTRILSSACRSAMKSSAAK